jgi:LPS-assembly protein
MKRSVAPIATAALLASTLAISARADSAADRTVDNLHGQMLLRADQAQYDTDRDIVSAVGHVEIDDQGRILLADRVDYDQKKDIVTASGHVSLMDEKGNVAFADHVTLTDRLRDGSLEAFSALLGKNGRLAAASGKRIAGRYTIANHAAYTPCKICNLPGQRTPLWRVQAYRVIYDQDKHELHFHDASIEFFGVPVFYTPYFSEPDPTVRYSTGILTPTVGTSTFIGYYASVPVYIALSDSNDATISPLVSTKGGELLEAEYRQRWNDGGGWLQVSGANNPSGGVNESQNQTYGHIFGSVRYPFSDSWSFGGDAQYTSNDTYLRRYDISQLDRLNNDLFVDGENGLSRLFMAGYYFEGLRSTDRADTFPYVLPYVQYSLVPTDPVLGGQTHFTLNGAAIDRTLGPTSQRLSGEINWSLPFVLGGGQLYTLVADARGDFYHIYNNDINKADYGPPYGTSTVDNLPTDVYGNPAPLGSHYIKRGLPYVALDWRWPFVNDYSAGHAIILEPIAQVIAEPYGGNPHGLPDEDSAAFETDENDLFSFDRVPGYDILESGPRVNAGFRAEAIFPAGEIETEWGQTYRAKPDPVFAADTGDGGTVSDIVGRVSIKIPPYLDVTDRIDLDRQDGSVRRHEIYVTGTYGRSSIQISYVQLPPEVVSLGFGPREEVTAQSDINFYGNWQAFGAIRRDLIADQMLNAEFGIGYEDECLGIGLSWKRTYTTVEDLPPGTAIVLRLNLKTTDKAIAPFDLFPRDVFNHP